MTVPTVESVTPDLAAASTTCWKGPGRGPGSTEHGVSMDTNTADIQRDFRWHAVSSVFLGTPGDMPGGKNTYIIYIEPIQYMYIYQY